MPETGVRGELFPCFVLRHKGNIITLRLQLLPVADVARKQVILKILCQRLKDQVFTIHRL